MKTRLWPDGVAIATLRSSACLSGSAWLGRVQPPSGEREACLNLDMAPENGTVVAVVSNTDYQYQGDETRKRKYDYRLRLLEGVTGSAPTTGKY